MRKSLKFILITIMVLSLVNALGSAPKKSATAVKNKAAYAKELLIDNFDDADVKAAPAWWTFDNIKLNFPEAKSDKNGSYYLKITGQAANYYVGGMGTYLGKDAVDYDTFVVSVFGTGLNSGTLRLQLYDDDNKTYQLEQDSTYQSLYDDYLEYELTVTWEGWRTVEIPITKFVDMNQGVGDDIWNPEQKDGSGGLLHFQYVVIATSEKGSINIGLDNMKLIKKTDK